MCENPRTKQINADHGQEVFYGGNLQCHERSLCFAESTKSTEERKRFGDGNAYRIPPGRLLLASFGERIWRRAMESGQDYFLKRAAARRTTISIRALLSPQLQLITEDRLDRHRL
jgi:hypothetical protein